MPVLSKNYYEFFGIPRSLRVDTSELQKRFYELSREWHPDRFSRKSAEEQAQALEATAILNDGYRTLRDPVKRAEYLLKEEGFPIGEQRSRDVPPELLEEVFELNMTLEELKKGDESARPQLETAKENFIGLRDAIDTELDRLFAKYDACQAQRARMGAPRQGKDLAALGGARSAPRPFCAGPSISQSESAKQALQEIRGALNRRRYIENLIRDVDRALNSGAAPPESLEDLL